MCVCVRVMGGGGGEGRGKELSLQSGPIFGPWLGSQDTTTGMSPHAQEVPVL